MHSSFWWQTMPCWWRCSRTNPVGVLSGPVKVAPQSRHLARPCPAQSSQIGVWDKHPGSFPFSHTWNETFSVSSFVSHLKQLLFSFSPDDEDSAAAIDSGLDIVQSNRRAAKREKGNRAQIWHNQLLHNMLTSSPSLFHCWCFSHC